MQDWTDVIYYTPKRGGWQFSLHKRDGDRLIFDECQVTWRQGYLPGIFPIFMREPYYRYMEI